MTSSTSTGLQAGVVVLPDPLPITPNKEIIYTYAGKQSTLSNDIVLDPQVVYDTKSITTPWYEQKNTIVHFGFNLSIPNDPTGALVASSMKQVSFTIATPERLEPTKTGVRYEINRTDLGNGLESITYVEYDYSDLLGVLQEDGSHWDPDLEKWLPAKVPVPYTISTSPLGASITFDVHSMIFRQGQTIVFDPVISINNVQNYTSTTNNVTCEAYPLCHITMNESSLLLSLPFDVPFTAINANISYDYTSYNNDGFANNFSMYNGTGYIGGGITNPGNNQNSQFFIPTNTNLNATTEFTIGYWLEVHQCNGLRMLVVPNAYPFNQPIRITTAVGAPCSVGMDSFNSVGTSSSVATVSTLNEGQWYFLVFTRNSTHIVAYLNGAFEARTSASGVVGFGSNMVVGGNGGAQQANASFDNVFLFNRSLTAGEINSIYHDTYPFFAGPSSTQTFANINISQNGSLNNLNITTNTTLLNQSNMSVMVLEYNLSSANTANSTLKYLANGSNQVMSLSIANTTYNVSLLFNYTPSDSNNFYSPIIRETIELNSYFQVVAVVSSCTLLTVSGKDYWPCTCNINSTKTGTGSTHFIINGTGEIKINSSINNYSVKLAQGLSTTQLCIVKQYGGVI